MSGIILGKAMIEGVLGYYCLDTDNLVCDIFTREGIKAVERCGVKVCSWKDGLHVGLDTSSNRYEIYVKGYSKPIYTGYFPMNNNRGDLFNISCKLVGVSHYDDSMLIAIGCNCYCEYGIEVAMSMLHVVQFKFRSMKSGDLIIRTSKPVVVTTLETAKRGYESCHGDYPYDCCIITDRVILKKSKLSLYGVTLDHLPDVSEGYDLCNDLTYLSVV